MLGRLLLPDVHFQWLFLPGVVAVLLVPLIVRMVPAHVMGPAEVPVETKVPRNRVSLLFAPEIRRTTILFWGAAFMSLALLFSTTSWLPTVMMKAGYDLSSSLEFLTTFTAGAVIGGLVLSPIADRGHLRLVTFGTFVLAAIALFVLSTPQPRPLLLGVSALAGLGSLGCQNMLISCMSAFYPPHLRGTGLGVGLGVGRLGAIFGPAYLAVVTGSVVSPRAGFFAFIVLAVLGAIIVALLPRQLAPSGEHVPTQAATAVA